MGLHGRRRSGPSVRKHGLPVVLHRDDDPSHCICPVDGSVQPAEASDQSLGEVSIPCRRGDSDGVFRSSRMIPYRSIERQWLARPPRSEHKAVSLIYDLIGYVFLVIAALIPIANPFSTAPVFITLTSSLSRQERHRTATLACTYMGLLLIVFLLAGAVILQFLGIGWQALRVGGGLIIAYMGFRMLFPADQSEEVGDTSKIAPPVPSPSFPSRCPC